MPPELYLIDVGVSGGIDAAWLGWKEKLYAVGIDALVKEVDRLQKLESSPNIQYEAAFLKASGDSGQSQELLSSNYALHRSSAYMGTVLHALGPHNTAPLNMQEYLELWKRVAIGELRTPPREANYGSVEDPNQDPFWCFYQRRFEKSIGLEDVELSSRRATLDQVMASAHMHDVDLLKIDTDGYELDILRGARDTLNCGCLMVEVEVQFHGLNGPSSNVFANIDTFLRDAGFTLLKLDAQCYGRSALPRDFEISELPAQTRGGPIQWGDALYGRDLLTLEENSLLSDDRKVRIMACLYEVYGLECAAAELVLKYLPPSMTSQPECWTTWQAVLALPTKTMKHWSAIFAGLPETLADSNTIREAFLPDPTPDESRCAPSRPAFRSHSIPRPPTMPYACGALGGPTSHQISTRCF